MDENESFVDGYDLGFHHMLLAADERMRRDCARERQRQKLKLHEAKEKKAKMLKGNVFDNFSEDAEIPLTGIVQTISSITKTAAVINARSTYDDAAAWCATAIKDHVTSFERSEHKEPTPARSALNRDETLELMQHVQACQRLLNAT